MKFCKSCILPDTRPNLFLNSNGICNACIDYKKKPLLDWKQREKHFQEIIKKFKNQYNDYDCIVPVSGGKDSTWKIIKCLEHNLKPLAVTWKTPSRTEIGQKNLDNLINLGVDHIDYQINPKVESKFMLETFKKFGSTAIPMHLAIFSFPIKIAIKFDIPLIIWGENSAREYGGLEKDISNYKLNKNWFKKYGVTNGTVANDWISKKITKKDLSSYYELNWKEINQKNIYSIFLGEFFKWDTQNSYKIAKKHGFKTNTTNIKTGYYKHTDIDCNFISIHHWMKWYKFGFTRAMDNLSLEIRENRITRNKAINIIKKLGEQKPVKDIKKFCKFANISEKKFFQIAERHRNKNIWLIKNKKWKLRNFII